MKNTSKAKALGNLLEGLDDDCRSYCRQLLDRTVKPDTSTGYRQMVRLVVEEGGGTFDFFGFVRHLLHVDVCAKAGYSPDLESLLLKPTKRRLATQTLRARKSACIHVSLCEGIPWSEEESWYADRMLDGRASDDNPSIPRIALSQAQLDIAIPMITAMNKDCGEGLEVMYAACLRSQDVRKMDASWVDLDPSGADTVPTCMSLRKASERVALREGPVTYNPILPLREGRAMKILRERVAKQRDGAAGYGEVLFPEWDEARIAKALKSLARIHKWEGRIDGTHNFRHTAARHAHQASMLEVMRRGDWKSEAAALRRAQLRTETDQPRLAGCGGKRRPTEAATTATLRKEQAANARKRAAAGRRERARRS